MLLLLALALAGSGCVSAGGYFGDRWADAKDIITVSGGTGLGAKARVGPLNIGLLQTYDFIGLRGGEAFIGRPMSSGLWPTFEGDIDVAYEADLLVFWFEAFGPEHRGRWQERGKAIAVLGLGVALQEDERAGGQRFNYSYYTQLEVAAGVGGTLRLGFNVGELSDFVLGWTTLDIYGDDLEARKEREEAEKKPKEPSAPPAPKQPGATP